MLLFGIIVKIAVFRVRHVEQSVQRLAGGAAAERRAARGLLPCLASAATAAAQSCLCPSSDAPCHGLVVAPLRHRPKRVFCLLRPPKMAMSAISLNLRVSLGATGNSRYQQKKLRRKEQVRQVSVVELGRTSFLVSEAVECLERRPVASRASSDSARNLASLASASLAEACALSFAIVSGPAKEARSSPSFALCHYISNCTRPVPMPSYRL